MPGKLTTHPLPDFYGANFDQTLTAGGQVTDSVMLAGRVAVQFTGTATSVTAQVERSTRDPALGSPNWAPAGDPFTGNPSTANFQPRLYDEAGVAWWRVRCPTITGGSVLVAINGKAA